MKKSIKDTKEKTTKKDAAESKVIPRAYTFYDVYSKQRGYICSCIDEDGVHRSLKSLFRENERFSRRSEGKKFKSFDYYGVARCGNSSRIIELMFEEETETDTYDDVVEQQQAAAK